LSGWLVFLFGVALALLSFAAPAQIKLQDDRGVARVWATPPVRVVSLLPSLTESVCALGGCGRLVGVDRHSNSPASVRGLPQLGGLEDASLERIVALKPDVVLMSASARLADRLEALGVRVLVLESRNHADVQRSLTLLAQLLGRPAEGARLWAGIQDRIQAAARRVPLALHGQSVYFELDATPYAAGAGSFIGETLAQLGLKNALPPELGAFPKLNPEYVVRLQPHIVMASQADLKLMRQRPGWVALKALAAGHSCGFSSERYELLIRPGPRLGEAADALADCLVAVGKVAVQAQPSGLRGEGWGRRALLKPIHLNSSYLNNAHSSNISR
jgi:iron complex transport system substrate-binding protein